MLSSLRDILLDGPFELTARPEPIPGDLRLAWGIALVILILGRSRAKRASLQKLHFMAHSARTRATRDQAERLLAGTLTSADMVVRVEPWLNRAIAFATAAHLVSLEHGGHARLTDSGIETFEKVSSTASLMAEEKAFIEAVARQATEGAIDKIMRMEQLL
jgi:citrate lyase gamma subunit